MPWYDRFDAVVADRLPEMEVLRQEPMAGHTTFRVGGPACRMARPTQIEELTTLLQESGCRVTWKFPEETGFYQPIVMAKK